MNVRRRAGPEAWLGVTLFERVGAILLLFSMCA